MKILLVGGPRGSLPPFPVADADGLPNGLPWLRGDDFAYRRAEDFRIRDAVLFVYAGPNEYTVALPDCDAWGVPLEKMPRCPKCGGDELGMLRPGTAICYACGLRVGS